MKTKKIADKLIGGFAIVLSMLIMIACARAGSREQAPVPPEPSLERLRQDLQLTEEQSAKVGALMDESAKQEKEVLGRYGLSPEQFQVLQKDLHRARDGFFTGLQSILTDEQKKILRQPHKPMDRHQPPPPPPFADER